VLKHLAEGAAHTAADLCRRMHYDTGSHDSHSRAAEIEALKDYLGRMIDNGQPRGDNAQRPTGGKS
jgi:hypothetical protein